MHVDLLITTATEYFEYKNIEIDYAEANNPEMISVNEMNMIQNILTCEVSIYLLRRSTGHCGSVTDNMSLIREKFIKTYEKKYQKKYTNYNENKFY